MKRTKRIIGVILLVAIITTLMAVPTVMADTKGYDCPSCGTGSLYTYTVYGEWYGYHTTSCTHGLQGVDKYYWRLVEVYDKCNNCGAMFKVSEYTQNKIVCMGY